MHVTMPSPYQPSEHLHLVTSDVEPSTHELMVRASWVQTLHGMHCLPLKYVFGILHTQLMVSTTLPF